MKKTASRIITAVLALCLLFSAAACGKTVERDDSYSDKFETAVENSLKADIYFIKETKNEGKLNYTRRINVLPALEGRDSTPVKKENGDYKDLRISINISDFDNNWITYRCGMSASSQKKDSAEYRFIRKEDKTGKVLKAVCTPMEPNKYYDSKEFSKNRIEYLIDELRYLDYEDMNFDIDGAQQKTVGKVVTMIFAPTEKYLKEYEKETGRKSLFDGASKVLIETAYDRISNVTVYDKEAVEGTDMSVETERYKLEIVYLGPKITDIPSFDAVDKDKKPVWTKG